MILIRLALYLTLAGAFGLVTFAWWSPTVITMRRALEAIIVAALVLSFWSLVLLAGQMGGDASWPVDWETIEILLGETAVGRAWLVRICALLIAGIAIRFEFGILATLACAIALASLAWAGHGAMDEGSAGWLHLGADVLHLLASGVWVGALAGLILLVMRPETDVTTLALTHRALRAFAPIGTGVVGVLIVTGLVNAWLLVGPALGHALATAYGVLLLVKLLLFAAMLGLAWLNRFRLTPRFEQAIANGDCSGALHALRVSLALETGAVVLILAIVAWIGTIEPPVSSLQGLS